MERLKKIDSNSNEVLTSLKQKTNGKNLKILEFVSDDLKFNFEVLKDKAPETLPFDDVHLKQIFKNKNHLANGLLIETNKYKKSENNANVIKKFSNNNFSDYNENLVNNNNNMIQSSFEIKYKPKNYFHNNSKSLSNENLKINKNGNLSDQRLNKSMENLNANQNKIQNSKNSTIDDEDHKDWDHYLIDSLSENTARWIVYKRLTDTKQKQKLQSFLESKFGRYTRNIRDLELVEDSLTDFEKRKILEEKERLKAEKEAKEKEHHLVLDDTKNEESNKKQMPEEIPLYRLPQGIKRIELKKKKMPDPNYNKTANNITYEPSRILSPISYNDKMKKNKITEMSLFLTEVEYTNEIIGGNSMIIYNQDEDILKLNNGKTFQKTFQKVFPENFTQWVNDISNEKYQKNDSINMQPIKGKKNWKKYPELIENSKINKPSEPENESENFWHLLPLTPDTELRKVLKNNFTVAKILDDWRQQWQISNRWTNAEVDELINDMKSEQANIRFQAVVVCSRAAEKFQSLIDKLANFQKKIDVNGKYENLNEELKELYKQRSELLFFRNDLETSQNKTLDYLYYDLMFSEKLFEAIELLLNDLNSKVSLAASISLFIILRKFPRPYTEKCQLAKNKAENILKQALISFSKNDKYASAICLANDGYCDELIVNILIKNYFNSNEKYTKEQVAKCISDLSSFNDIIATMLENYFESDNAREKILSCKLFPCLRGSFRKEGLKKLIHLMWNDTNKNVKKVAAQTLGRIGQGKLVHDEIYNRLESKNAFDRIDALKIINYIGIMTSSLIPLYLKCFRDEYIIVRELACISSQKLYINSDKLFDSLIFMARFDKVTKLKALAIRTLGLIGNFDSEIKKILLWALQFEIDPMIRTEACHSLILLTKSNLKDPELIDLLLELHLVEEEQLVKNEINNALKHLGYDLNKKFPIILKIENDVKKLNDKNLVIKKILEIEKDLNFEMEKKRLIWNKETAGENDYNKANKNQENLIETSSSVNSQAESFGPFEPRLIEKTKKKNKFYQKESSDKSFMIEKNFKHNNNFANFLTKLIPIDKKDLVSSFSSFETNSIEDYAKNHYDQRENKNENINQNKQIDQINEKYTEIPQKIATILEEN